MGKYLDILKAAGLYEAPGREKSERSEKRVPGAQDGGGLFRFSRFFRTLSILESRCPDHVPIDRWQQAVEDGRRFLATWETQAQALGWTSADLFGLHTPPAKPHPSYSRLSRYDCTGLCWLLQGREVIALTADTATIKNPVTTHVTVFRKNNRPAYGPLGDSLDDLK